MPITTDTLWNQKRLNLAFALSGLAFLGTTIWMIYEDHFRPWKDHQADYQSDITLLTELELERYAGPDFQRQLDAAGQLVARIERDLDENQIYQQRSRDKYDAEQELQGAALAFNNIKSVLDVGKQDYERAVVAYGEEGEATQAALRVLRAQEAALTEAAELLEKLEDQIKSLKRDLKQDTKDRDEAKKALAALERKRETAMTRLALNENSLTNILRNTVLDFAVGTIKVKGGIVPLVNDELNFMRQPRIDRCQTCHIAIDDVRFTEEELVVSLALNLEAVNSERRERGYQAASADVEVKANKRAAQDFRLLPARLAAVDASADIPPATYQNLPGGNQDSSSGTNGQSDPEADKNTLGAIAGQVFGDSQGERAELRGVAMFLSRDGRQVRQVRTDSHGRYEFAGLEPGRYRLEVRQFEEIPLPFTLPDVKPVSAPMPEAASEEERLYSEYIDRLSRLDDDREQFIRDLWDRLTLSGDRGRQTEIFDAVVKAANAYRESQGRSTLNLEHPLRAHPNLDLYVSADSKHPMKQMGCTVCHGGNGDETSFTTASHTASSHEQEEHWIEKYEGRIDYKMAQHWWQEPMLQAKYVEASCLKCHTAGADVSQSENRPLATRIANGRQLFTQTGCINCHKVQDLDASRKVGPDLQHIKQKLSPEFAQQWIWYPRDFRPSTWMPHFFKQENNFAKSDLPNDPDPDPQLRTQTEVAAMAHWLYTFSTDYEREPLPEGLSGDVERGRKLFDTTGCLGCHAALNHRRKAEGPTLGVQWIAADLAHREELDATLAVSRAKGMTYAEQIRYAMKHLTKERRDRMQRLRDQLTWEERKARLVDRDAARADAIQKRLDEEAFVPAEFTRFAPELSGIGSKVSLEWLYDWVRNPRHYHSYTKMPRLRLSEQEALDVAGYLTTMKNDGFRQAIFDPSVKIDLDRDGTLDITMRDKLILELLEGQNSKSRAELILESADPDEAGTALPVTLSDMLKQLAKTIPDRARAEAIIDGLSADEKRLLFLGNKMIAHYGCASCHSIPGFEKTTRPGTELTEWAEKPLNKLDFAFFEHVFHDKRGDEYKLLYPEGETFAHLIRDGGQHEIHPMHSHASFALHKMQNPRLWDRGRMKSAYDKLKMPNFFFTDDEAEALTTYLRSRQEALVSDQLIPSATSHLPAIAAGRNLVAELNCTGCHKIEGNSAAMHQFILAGEFEAQAAGEADEADEDDEWDEEGEGDEEDEWGEEGDEEPDDGSAAVIAAGSGGEYDEVNGPPWLRGEGAKVQPAWLDDFLHNVETLRPWLRVRMPSYHLTNEQSITLVDYFAAVSQRESQVLRRHLAPVRKYLDKAMAEPIDGNQTPPQGRTPGDQWFRRPQLKKSARFLSQYAIDNRLRLNPLAFHGDPSSDKLAESYLNAVLRAEFIEQLYDIKYPFGATPRELVDDNRFELGRELTLATDVLNCLACHALGDPNVPGAKKNPSAPNLSLAFRRLRREWIYNWLQEPAYMQPGTQMPQWFAGGDSAFVDFGDVRSEMEAKFGATGEEQMQLMMDFLHEAGARAYTGVPSASGLPAAAGAEE